MNLSRRWAAPLLTVAAALLAPTAAVHGQDAASPPERKPLPVEPAKKLLKEIESALPACYERTVWPTNLGLEESLAVEKSLSRVSLAVRDWYASITPDHPLRNVAWWRKQLMTTLPTGQPAKRRQFNVKYAVKDVGEWQLLVNVPSKYSPKEPSYPLLLVGVEDGADPRVLLKQHYGPLLESHIIVGFPLKSDAGGNDGILIQLGLAYAIENYRIDPERVTLDGLGSASRCAAWLAADSVILFNGVVLRNPPAPDALGTNLAMCPVTVVGGAGAAEAYAGVNPATKHVAATDAALSFASRADDICAWIAALGPRPVSDPALAFTWKGRTVGRFQKVGYWFRVDGTLDSDPELTVTVEWALDPAANAVNVTSRNLDRFTCLLNDEVLDLDHPVAVRVNGIEVLKTRVQRSTEALLGWPLWELQARPQGRSFVCTAELDVKIPEEARRPEADRRAEEEAARPPEEKPAPAPVEEKPAPAEEKPAPTEEKPAEERPVAAKPADSPAMTAYDRGLDYLKGIAVPVALPGDGEGAMTGHGWVAQPGSKDPNPGVTALAATPFLFRPGGIRPGDEALVRGALGWLAGSQNPDGGIYDNSGNGNYTTSIAVEAFRRADSLGKSGEAKYAAVVEKAAGYLKSMQFTEEGFEPPAAEDGKEPAKGADGKSLASRRVDRSDSRYGGFGYGSDPSQPDLSNTQFAIQSLRAAGVPESDPAIQKALTFLNRSQNRKENETEGEPKSWKNGEGKDVLRSNDGGAVYRPGDSKAGVLTDPDGTLRLRSYGSMTYALLRCYLNAGIKVDDPRVRAAIDWLHRNYTWQSNPGFAEADLGQQGLYYYYATAAQALDLAGLDVIAPPADDAEGTPRQWRTDLAKVLLEKQNEEGSWTNANDRWMEALPVVATSFALRALAATIK